MNHNSGEYIIMKEQSTQQVRLWTTDFILLMLCNFLLFLQLHMIVSPLPSYVQERFHANAFEVSLFTPSVCTKCHCVPSLFRESTGEGPS